MRRLSRKWRWLAVVVLLLAVAFGVVRTWVVPALIVSEIEKRYQGKVVVRDWWFGLSSSGIKGIELHEGKTGDSPVWLKADRISTNVSIGRLLKGKIMPDQVEIDRPRITFLLDAKGQPTTKIPLAPTAADQKVQKESTTPLPAIVTKNGEVTLQQSGRKPMTITGVNLKLTPTQDGEDLVVTTDDPTWGQVKVVGHFDPTFKNGQLEIDSSPGFVADPDKIERIPFIPPEVWANIEPRGPVDAKVKITLAADAPKPVKVYTELNLRGTSAKLSTLQVSATDTTGHVVIDDAVVKVDNLRGKTLDGSMATSGTLDFSQNPPRFALDLRLKDIDATKAPASWQLGEMGATGKLTGKVDLRVDLAPKGVDLTGTSGEAVIENGSFQGIPIKSLSVNMKASGGDLQFETSTQATVNKQSLESAPQAPPPSAVAGKVNAPNPARPAGPFSKLRPPAMKSEIWEPALALAPMVRLATHDEGFIGWAAYLATEAASYQAKHHEPGQTGGLRLPKTITTRLELEDVDLKTLVDKAEKFGIKIPVPVAGRFSIKATATIPLGTLRDIKAYAFHGDASLAGASIDNVDLGKLTAHLDLVDGVLDLSDFRGQFVDKPNGSETNTPRATEAPPKVGELPVGGFRASLRAEIEPRGSASAKIEGRRLPLGELFAPALPVPTPLSGDLSLNVDAKVNLATLADPKTYDVNGHVDSHHVAYQTAVLDEMVTSLSVKAGRLTISGFSARLANRPLKASGDLDLAAPYQYTGQVSVEGWEIADVLAFIPNAPRPSPASGTIDVHGDARGTLTPFAIQTGGQVKIGRAKAGPLPLGNVAFQWKTDQDTIAIHGLDAAIFGGRVTGDARIPTKPGRPLEATISLKGIDSTRLSSPLLGKSMTIQGKADGHLHLKMPLDASTIDADALLTSPDLTIRHNVGDGVRVDAIKITATARDKQINYDATARGLGGKYRFHGKVPINPNIARIVADGEFQAAGFRLVEIWRGLGMTGALAELDGQGAFDANLRANVQPFQPWSRGIFEFRDLKLGHHLPLGNLKGTMASTPTTWQVDQLYGDLLGGLASGQARSETKVGGGKRILFDFKVDRASLPKMMVLAPALARQSEGFGSLVVAGRLDEELRANAEVLIPRARILGLPLSDLRFPGELDLNPATGMGSFHSRHWNARLAGGSVQGNAFLKIGEDRSFQTEIRLNDVDIEVINRIETDGKKAASGKVSGKITLNGPNPSHIAKYRGRFDLDLDDASLVEMPVIREVDRFLGAAKGGGLFEDGDIHGNIANKTLFIESMTLQGRLVQIHVTGTVTFDGGLSLEVLVNTNQIIPQSGLAFVNLIPGLGEVLGRGEEVFNRLGSFLSSKLLKIRVSGNVKNPTVAIDTGVAVGSSAVGFFSSVFKLPGGK